MSNYTDFHVAYTLPAIGILAFVARPFLNPQEMIKIGTISMTVAVAYAAQWKNKDVTECVVFAVVQTILTVLWTFLCTRWSMPCEHFNHDRQSYRWIRWIPIIVLTTAVTVTAGPADRAELLLCWTTSLWIAFMWYEAGNFFVKNLIPRSVAIAVPTAYLCWVRCIGLPPDGTDGSDSKTHSRRPDEPLAVLATSVFVVLAATCYDKAFGMMETFVSEYPVRFGFNRKYIGQTFRALVTPEYRMASIVTEDIKTCIRTTNAAVSTTGLSCSLFPAAMRLDMMIIYLFYRVTDDFVDDDTNAARRQRKMDLTTEFLDEVFADRQSDYHVNDRPRPVNVDWTKYRAVFTDEEMACYRAFSRIAFYTPRKHYYDLLDGYRWDIARTASRTEDDLKLYSYQVGGSYGELCVYVMMYKHDDSEYDDAANVYGHVLRQATRISQSLQMVNMARDIVNDSETHGRCYVLPEFMDDEREEWRMLHDERSPRALGDDKLKRYFVEFCKLSDKYYAESVDAIARLPRETRAPCLAAVDMYRGHLAVIRSSATYPFKAKVPKWKKISIALCSLYIKSFKYVI